MRKFIFLLLFLVIFALASCDSNVPENNDSTNSGGQTQEPEEPTILDFKNIVFTDKSVIYDGNPHTIEVVGAPDFATVTYINAGPHTNVGIYEISATVEAEGYNTLNLKATLTIGNNTTGLSFEEYNRYVINKPFASLPYTIEMDIKLAKSVTGNAGSLVSNMDWVVYGANVGNARLFHTEIVDGQLKLHYTKSNYPKGHEVITFDGVDLRTGDWVNAALTIDVPNKKAHLYVNGELKVTKSITCDLYELIGETKFHIGGDNRTLNPNYFKGEIRSVAIYDDVRSASEIQNDYQNGVDLTDANLMAQYNMSSLSIHNNLADNSGNGYWARYEDTWYDNQEIEMDYAYSFAVVGDTQMLNFWGQDSDMNTLYKWIVDNVEEQKIQHVFGLGDITETWGKDTPEEEYEWQRAKDAIYLMNDKVSYSLVRGNHDESNFMNQYFNEDVYKSQFGGFYNDGTINTSWKTLKVGNIDFLLIGLDFGASDDELAWAGSIVEAHPNHKVIVTTHGYLEQEGNRMDADYPHSPSAGSDFENDKNYNHGDGIWEKFVSKYENIFLVMSGHINDEDVVYSQDYGVHGNVVTQILIDFQDVDKALVQAKGQPAAGIVTMLYMNEDCTKVEIAAYSTIRDKFYKKYNHFTIDLEGTCKEKHNLTKHEEIKETCTTDGVLEYYSCSNCVGKFDADGNVLFDIKKPATGHNYDNGVLNGKEIIYTCANCGDAYKEYLNCTIEVNHLYLDGTVATQQEVMEVTENTMYTVNAKTINGYVASHDYVKVYTSQKTNIINIYYSQVDKWDGKTVSSSLSGRGTKEDPYLIESAADLAYLQSQINAITGAAGTNYKTHLFIGEYFKMTKSIDLNGANFQIGYHGGWNNYQCFAGTFDGNNCTIRGLNTNNTTSSAALFGCIQTMGSIKNLSVYGSVTGKTTVGGVVAYLLGTAENVTSYVTVKGESTVGGIAANSENTTSNLINCVNYGNVTGSSYIIGGIAGSLGHNAKNCINYGNVTSGSECSGGIGGSTKDTGTIENCINYGTVTGKGQRGGIIGKATSLIKNCINYGLIENNVSGWNVGGIVGETSANVESCTNYGEVHGVTTHVAGIVGSTTAGNVTDCVNEGLVNGFSWGAGGIVGCVGANTQVISNCINKGDVLGGQGQVGGIVGKGMGTVKNCDNYGVVVNGSLAGGIVGDSQNSTTVTDCNDYSAQ